MFVELAVEAPSELLDQMYGFIDQIPMTSYNEAVICLLRDFTLNAIENMNSEKGCMII
jgi:hypothetical protein